MCGHWFSGRSKALVVFKGIRRGWFLGEDTLQQELLGQMSARVGEHHYAEERQECGEARAQGIITGELKQRRKGDPGKVRIAWRLRRETTMTLKWITAELEMGAWTHVSNLLSQYRNKNTGKQA